jgi:hypothetical protein
MHLPQAKSVLTFMLGSVDQALVRAEAPYWDVVAFFGTGTKYKGRRLQSRATCGFEKGMP